MIHSSHISLQEIQKFKKHSKGDFNIKKFSKKISIFSIISLIVVLFVSSFPLNAAGAYLVDVGDEWTYMTKEQGISQGTEGINITSVPAPPAYPLGTIYINVTATLFNQAIDEEYLVNETVISELEANYSVKTRSYGGVSCECVYIPKARGLAIRGFWYVDIATGIIVETYDVYLYFFIEEEIKVHRWVISWSVTEFPEDPEEPSTGGGGGDVPGYDILFIIGIIAVISTVLTIGFKKKFKT